MGFLTAVPAFRTLIVWRRSCRRARLGIVCLRSTHREADNMLARHIARSLALQQVEEVLNALERRLEILGAQLDPRARAESCLSDILLLTASGSPC
jgi:hypothetical protein